MMKLLGSRCDNDGFTLIEVIFSFLVIGLVLISIAMTFTNGYTFIGEIRDVAAATQAAQEGMELIRGKSFGDVDKAA